MLAHSSNRSSSSCTQPHFTSPSHIVHTANATATTNALVAYPYVDRPSVDGHTGHLPVRNFNKAWAPQKDQYPILLRGRLSPTEWEALVSELYSSLFQDAELVHASERVEHYQCEGCCVCPYRCYCLAGVFTAPVVGPAVTDCWF